MSELTNALKRINDFVGNDLTGRISSFEYKLKEADKNRATDLVAREGINYSLFYSADFIKKQVSQINTIVHAVGILAFLPKILETGESIQDISLGASSSESRIDLETNFRIAEFEFSEWLGNDSSRKKALFEDFYRLAEYPTAKSKYLFLYDTELPIKFLSGHQKINTLLVRDKLNQFKSKFGNEFNEVNQYYKYRKNFIKILGIDQILQH